MLFPRGFFQTLHKTVTEAGPAESVAACVSCAISWAFPVGPLLAKGPGADPGTPRLSCPDCGKGRPLLNQHNVYGDGWAVALTGTRRHREAQFDSLLRWMAESPEATVDEIADAIELHTPWMQPLAEWFRQQRGRVIGALGNAVLGAIVAQMLFGGGVSAEELERIVNEQQRDPGSQQHGTGDQGGGREAQRHGQQDKHDRPERSRGRQHQQSKDRNTGDYDQHR